MREREGFESLVCFVLFLLLLLYFVLFTYLFVYFCSMTRMRERGAFLLLFLQYSVSTLITRKLHTEKS